MSLLIKSKKHLYTRVPIVLISIGLFALSPIFIGLIGAWMSEATTGEPCHEGNCVWGTIPWLFFFTFPIAGILFIIFLIIVIIDSVKLRRQD